jgi:hypothetical protein
MRLKIKNPISTQAIVIQMLIASEKINLIFLRAYLIKKELVALFSTCSSNFLKLIKFMEH